ncbi:hypothetical protein WN59_06715 [Salinicoccus sediminis]|uniref:Uncharacterized protein n=1 Tax=Salinicoccus sediminis TaxID=1432562 RepID=A0A0M2SQ33_9STAP|nr:hypothetical protein [Salinicoccus sediminis]KKK34715.1 hypothetical protein WN59_06715 [Salinicoccus sediminis]
MNEHNKEIFTLFKDYRWMKKLIEEKESLAQQYSNDPFLSMLNQGFDQEVNDLKEKVAYVDKNIELIEDDKIYWILNLLRRGYTVKQIKQIIPISNRTFYDKCDKAMTTISNQSLL